MKVVKPFSLSLLTHPYRWQRHDTLGIAVLALATLENSPRLTSEQALWKLAAQETEPGTVLDLGVPKQHPEILASGYAYTCHQQDKTACAVKFQAGTLEKSLLVFGDRHWEGNRASAPRPFEVMPLNWGHAYGGAAIPDNPLGRGDGMETVDGARLHRLPNVEAPDSRLLKPGQHIQPASFSGIAPQWPQRMARMGKQYDQEWLEHDFPGYASDMDWRYFNAAAPDQWWMQNNALPGGLSYAFWNMNPDTPVLRGALPNWRARCFASRKADGLELEEASLRLTTAWFFPHLRRVMLIWHGALPIAEDDAADVRCIMPALEIDGQTRALAHYETVLCQRLDLERGATHIFRETDLVAPEACGNWSGMEGIQDPMTRPLARNARAGMERERQARRAELEAKGLDADKYLPQAMPAPEEAIRMEDLPAIMTRMDQERGYHDLLLREKLGIGLTGPPDLRMSSTENLLAKMREAQQAALPPASSPATPDKILRDLSNTFASLPARADASAAFDPDLPARMEPLVRTGYRMTAHFIDSQPRGSSVRIARTRKRVELIMARDRDFCRMSLNGADLSNMDLRGARFIDTLMEDVNLTNSVLDGCDLSRAVLARAKLDGVSLIGANLHQASLALASGKSADLTGANLTEANLNKTRLDTWRLDGACLTHTNLDEAVFEHCSLNNASLTGIGMYKSTLNTVSLRGAALSCCSWIECSLRNVDFSEAGLSRCSFVQVDAASLILSRARMEACSVALGACLASADLRDAHLKECGLRGTDMRDADLRQAKLEGCDFSECNFENANLDGAILSESLFIRANFTDASMRRTDLKQAILSKADLRRADAREANLFRADLGKARLDGSTLLDNAYTRQAKLLPKRQPQSVA
jgi:uncharacterized protein YjbI with pentapeptide repeats